MKKHILLSAVTCMLLVVILSVSALAESGTVAKIGDVPYTSLQEALNAAAAGSGNVTVEIIRDVNLTGVDWNPVTVSAPHYPVVTVKGNEHTITGLNDMLFAGTWAGGSGLIIQDLTIKDSTIVNDENDTKGTVGVGAFIGFPQASATVTLKNCHLVNSTVKGGHWTGGLIGIAGGYNGNDGPVFMNLTITGCSVTGSTITGKGSAGGVIGHGSCAAWTKLVIEDTTVRGNTVTSTGSSTNKAGSVMGTIGAAGQATTAAGETKTGGADVSATTRGNTVTSGGTEITTIYGRQGSDTGLLELVEGGNYEHYPIEKDVPYAKTAGDYELVESADGTFGVNPYIEVEFLTDPADATIVVTSSDGTTIAANSDGTYTLVEGAVYSYTASRDGHGTVTGSFLVTKDVPVTIFLHAHVHSSAWSSDADGHWHFCTVIGANCNEKFDYAEHTAGNWITVREATSYRTGLREKRCTVCNTVVASEETYKEGPTVGEILYLVSMMQQRSKEIVITATASAGGTVTDAGATQITYGTSKTYVMIPDVGYTVKTVLVDGQDIGAVSLYTFRDVKEKHTIQVVFEKDN